MFNLIYGELVTDTNETQQGVFLSVEEFAPYRRQGWTSSQRWNEAADAFLAREQREQDKPHSSE
ncbi:hypothetical protein [Thiocystis violacea]|uniref:hypothetical protein n=1 Tax=Thiocystis violacea TaxID=13725 RepID=UPI0019059D67|nr:hypothetical protein [Thiocystis violacea]MBK1722812.1 hypothetical protein [Thiocystis violacea]